MHAFSQQCNPDELGSQMITLMQRLYPICRSITGDGLRQTLQIIQEYVPLTLHEVPTGTQAFDWTVPKEWNVRDAYVKNERGEKVIDFQKHNLHLVNYSTPIHQKMSLAELKKHLHSLPEYPDWIPYRTSYYSETWGFCLSHNALTALEEGTYEVYVDSTLAEGHLTYGELVLPGATEEEVLISTHCCHPSLCNDNLAGIALATHLALHLAEQERRYTYRFLFLPGTIGAITWLAQHETQAARIQHGLVVACVGDPGQMTYKRSRRGDTAVDRAVAHVLQLKEQPYEIVDFSPYGYDERQYCSPGFNLAVGSLTRTPHGRFPQYHTSADNFDLVQPQHLADSLATYLAVLNVLEHNQTVINQKPKCEPQLGKRGLYGSLGGGKSTQDSVMAMLWVLNLADGHHTLLQIAEQANVEFELIRRAAEALLATDLLVEENLG
ncbi:MAG: DUF4910 domain-containing protein [Chloroflexota bacterium]